MDRLEAKSKHIDNHREKMPEFGACSSCAHLCIVKTQLLDRFVWCGRAKELPGRVGPNPIDPVVECSKYYPAGALTLREMTQIAYIIDVKKHQAGFIGTPEVTIESPEDRAKKE
ncbi:MAG: hypothetical protein PHU43_10030 [Candidatus Bipolaricaulis sp.]|nr:hypothetical protein [Candidatus Bipolaricaulis sp.]